MQPIHDPFKLGIESIVSFLDHEGKGLSQSMDSNLLIILHLEYGVADQSINCFLEFLLRTAFKDLLGDVIGRQKSSDVHDFISQ